MKKLDTDQLLAVKGGSAQSARIDGANDADAVNNGLDWAQ